MVRVRRLPAPAAAELLAARPALRGYDGRTVVVGIRPEDMEDAALVSDAPPTAASPSTVDLARRWAPTSSSTSPSTPPPALDRRRQGAGRRRRARRPSRRSRSRPPAGEASVVARLNPRTTEKGERIELVVDTHRLHFFDPDDGAGIYGTPDADDRHEEDVHTGRGGQE